jgi:hypothetical protein
MSPFDFVNALCLKTEHLLDPRGSTNPSLIESNSKEYAKSAFIINRAFSKNIDTVHYANAVNSVSVSTVATPLMQYDLYFHGVPKKKRYTKWAKAEKDLMYRLEVLTTLLHCSKSKAIQYLKLLSDDDIGDMISYYEKVLKAK